MKGQDEINAEVLPAYAGMIPSWKYWLLKLLCAPRIRGDDPRNRLSLRLDLQCSPHTRG